MDAEGERRTRPEGSLAVGGKADAPLQEICENLFFVRRGWLNGNHFVFKGEKKVLIDTAYVGDFQETRERIQAVGVDPADVDLIINTHCHCDHIGGNKRI